MRVNKATERKGQGVGAGVKKWHRRVDEWCGILAGVIIFGMMLLTSADIIMRYVFNAPIIGTFELMELLLPVAAYVGVSYVQQVRGHIAVEFIAERLPPKAAFRLDTAVLIIVLVVCVILTWQSAINGIVSWRAGDITLGLIEFPLGPPKVAVAFGLGLLCLRVLSQVFDHITAGVPGTKTSQEAS